MSAVRLLAAVCLALAGPSALADDPAAAPGGVGEPPPPAPSGEAPAQPAPVSGVAPAPSLPAAAAAGSAPAPDAPPLAAPGLLPPASLPPPRLLPEAARAPGRPHSYAWPAAESAAVTLVIMGWNRWVGEAPWAEISGASIARNLRSGWVLDDDQFWVNQFGHPYQGMWAHTAARSAGLSFWESFPYTFGSSLVWEFVGETERPAVNDQITTPIGGALFGEVLYRLSAMVRQGGRNPWREVAAAALSPMSAINRGLLGESFHEQEEPLAWQLSAGPLLARIPWEEGGPAPAWEGSPSIAYRLDHGLPWHPAFHLERPFDHFQLIAAYQGRTDPAATLLVRALLAGTAYQGPGPWRGVFGLYGGFDLDTPGVFRVSTSSVGVGTSGGAALSRGVEVEGTAILSGVLLGAAGRAARAPDGTGRDYHMGPGAQSVLEVKLTAARRASVRMGLREYVVFGAGEVSGTEVVGSASAAALLRVAGDHGVGVEATLWRRDLFLPEGTHLDQLGRAVRIFWALTGFHAPALGLAEQGG